METVELAYDVYETAETRSDKCPILFLHGLFWNKYMLRDLAKALCDCTQRKVFCPDLRCHDQSPFHRECNVYVIAEDLKKFIKDRGLEKVALVSHSASCTSAYFVTIDEPEMVEKLVLVDHPPFNSYALQSYKDNVVPQFTIQDRFLTVLDPSLSLAAAKQKILNLSKEAATVGQRIFLEKVAYELIKVNNKFKWKTDQKFLFEGYEKNFFVPARGRSDHEILIIRSENSTTVTDGKFEAIQRHNPNAKLVTIADSTHLLMFEQPEKFLEAVKEFLS